MLITIFLIIVTLLLSAFFSGSEIAFLSANKLSIEVLKNKGMARGKILAKLYDDPKTFLSTMLVGNNITLVIYTILFNSILFPLLSPYFESSSILLSLLITLLLTLVVLFFGEFLPKTFFQLYSNELIYRLAYPLQFFKYLLIGPSWVLTKISNMLIKIIFGNTEEQDDYMITKLDLEHYIQNNVSEEEEFDKEILKNALNLNQIKVRDCMIPRKEIVYVDKSYEIHEVKSEFINSKHSRLIVIDNDIDNVIGYIHHQQMFKNPVSIKRHIMDIEFVPETMNVQELMHHFMKNESNIACVVDEFGGTAGIITLEDILEEIFGEIADEHDESDLKEEQVNEREFVFSGRIELSYINNKYPIINFPDEEYVTLSGYIVMTHGSIPEIGEEIKLDNYIFKILERSDTRIELVSVTVETLHNAVID